MDFYPVLLFLHVLGAVGVFASFAIEVLAYGRLQQSRTREEARTWTALLAQPGRSGHLGMMTILVTGGWMMAVRWGAEAWMITAFVGLVAIIAVYMALARSPLNLLAEAVAGDGTAPDADWRVLAHDRRLGTALWLRAGLLAGIVGLMTVKPHVLGSLVILTAAAAGGLAFAVHANRPVTNAGPRSAAARGAKG